MYIPDHHGYCRPVHRPNLRSHPGKEDQSHLQFEYFDVVAIFLKMIQMTLLLFH